MDHIRIIRRAFDITRVYRALWVFGVLLALTTARGSNGGGGGGGASSEGINRIPFPRNWPPFAVPSIPSNVINSILGIIAAVACVALLLVVIFTTLRYVSATALIRMVNSYEDTGERVSVGTGFRLGWSRRAFRSWLANLIFGIAAVLFVILVALVVLAPLLLWATGDNTAGSIGVMITVGLGILAILLFIVVFAALSWLLQIIDRAIVLENLGVMDGIRRAWALFRRRLGDIIIMGLILFGIGLAFVVLMIPVFFILLLAALVVGGLPALLAGAITNIFVHGSVPQIVAAIVGAPIFLAVLILPLLFLGGLFETFKSTTWTLTFRELLALESVLPPAPAVPVEPVEGTDEI